MPNRKYTWIWNVCGIFSGDAQMFAKNWCFNCYRFLFTLPFLPRCELVSKIHRVRKKHLEHYGLSLEGRSNFNNSRYKYFWHNWPANDRPIFHLTQCLFLHNLGKTEPTESELKWTKIRQKHPQHYRFNLKKDWQILVIFVAKIFDTTWHQMIVLVPTLPNVCFCSTWKNPNRGNRIKMQYFVNFGFPGNAKADNGCGEKLDSHLIARCVRNIGVKIY